MEERCVGGVCGSTTTHDPDMNFQPFFPGYFVWRPDSLEQKRKYYIDM